MREPRNTQNTRKNGEVKSEGVDFNTETLRRRGWEVRPLRAFLSPKSERNRPDSQLLSVTREAGVIVRNTESKEENHNYIPDDLSNYKFVEKGQFVINKMKAWQGSYGVSLYDGIVSPAYFVYDLNFPCKEFFSLAIRSKAYVQYFQRFSKGIRVDQWDLMPEALKLIPFAFPSLPEQKAIVKYLDAETGRIDKAIAAEEKMIALLQERREIVINEAVSGSGKCGSEGIDFNAEAQRRRGWEVAKVKNLFLVSRGRVISRSELVDRGVYPVYSSQTENNGCLGYINTFDYEGEMLSWTTDGARAGTVFHRSGRFNCTNVCGMLMPRNRCNNNLRFLFYAVGCSAMRNRRADILGYKVMSNEMANFPVLLPPLSEQEEIVKYLDAETGKIDRAIEVKRRQIELLRERRQIVIDEVVTGKVKVA